MSLRVSPLTAIAIAGLLVLDGMALYGAHRGWENFDAGQRNGAARPGEGPWLAPSLAGGPGYRTKPLAAFAQTSARPIFTRTRRPFVAPVAAQPAAPAAEPSTPAALAAEPVVTLSAVTIHGQARRALLASKEHPGGRWMSEGDAVEGWAVTAIDADRLTLATGARSLTVRLYREFGAGADR